METLLLLVVKVVGTRSRPLIEMIRKVGQNIWNDSFEDTGHQATKEYSLKDGKQMGRLLRLPWLTALRISRWQWREPLRAQRTPWVERISVGRPTWLESAGQDTEEEWATQGENLGDPEMVPLNYSTKCWLTK